MVCTLEAVRLESIAMHINGSSYAKLASTLGLHRDTVGHWVNRYKATGTIKKHQSTGRPCPLSGEAAKEAVATRAKQC